MNIYEKKLNDNIYRLEVIDTVDIDDDFWDDEEYFNYNKLHDALQKIYAREDFNIEHNYALVFGDDFKCKAVVKIATGNEKQVSSNGGDFIFATMSFDCKIVICCHNHPNNIVCPSSKDIYAHIKNVEALESSGVLLFDSIVLGENDYFSFQEHDIWNPDLNDYGLEDEIEEAEIDNELDRDEPWFEYRTVDDCEMDCCAKISRKMYREKYGKKED